jgi:hypothetical protein
MHLKKWFKFLIYIEALHYVTYDWMNKVTFTYIRVFIVATSLLASC